jgi:DNA mismatch repair protein MutS
MKTLIQQYQAAKARHPEMLLLFRMGDFYEAFGTDAETLARIVKLTITRRDNKLSMTGFPHHSLEDHLQGASRTAHRRPRRTERHRSLACGSCRDRETIWWE